MSALAIGWRAALISASIIVASGTAVGAVHLPGIEIISSAIAYSAAFVLGILSVPVSLDGAVINAGGFLAVIADECTAIEVILVFSAGVLVSPVALKARGWALLLGIPSLCALNLVRVVSLLLAGIAFPQHFDTLHQDLWQPAMAVAALLMWLLWFWRAHRDAYGNDPFGRRRLPAKS